MTEFRQIPWVTVTMSETATREDGSSALCLHTQEAGPVAFAVDQRAIDAIRGHLDKIELGLRQPSGRAQAFDRLLNLITEMSGLARKTEDRL
jgi:hypothetical protein